MKLYYEEFDEWQFTLADITNNGTVNVADIVLMIETILSE